MLLEDSEVADHRARLLAEIRHGLASGEWSIVDHLACDGRRLVVARKCRPPRAPLTSREREIVERASLGHANKQIGYELDLASSTVATHLSQALRKLGLRSRQALIRAWVALGTDGGTRCHLDDDEHVVIDVPEPAHWHELTAAEREVVEGALAGCSNAVIARRRGTSARTVANQLAAAYRKLGIRSRAEMAARQ